MMIHFDVQESDIIRKPPAECYRISHEASTTLNCRNPEDPGINLRLLIDDENALQLYRDFWVQHVNKKEIVRHLRWKTKTKPYSSYISVSDGLHYTEGRFDFYKYGLKRKWISVAYINSSGLVPARYNGIIIYVRDYMRPEDGSAISVEQFNEVQSQVYLSVQQLMHDQAWPWAQIHTETDEWLVGGNIIKEDITRIEPFDGIRLLPRDDNNLAKVHIAGKVFNWVDEQWENAQQRKRKHDELETDTDIVGPSRKKLEAGIRDEATVEKVHSEGQAPEYASENGVEAATRAERTLQRANNVNGNNQFFGLEQKQALEVDTKNKMKEQLREEAQRMRDVLKEEIAAKAREEMKTQIRLEVEKELEKE